MSTLSVPLPLAAVPPASPAAAPARPKAGLHARFPAFPLQRTANPFRAFSDPTDQLLTAGSTRMLAGHPYPTNASGWVRYVPLVEGSGASTPTSSPSAPVSAPPPASSITSQPSSSGSESIVTGASGSVDRKGKGREVARDSSDGGEEPAFPALVPGSSPSHLAQEFFETFFVDAPAVSSDVATTPTYDQILHSIVSPDPFSSSCSTTTSRLLSAVESVIFWERDNLSVNVQSARTAITALAAENVSLRKVLRDLEAARADGFADRRKALESITDLMALDVPLQIQAMDLEVEAGKAAVEQTERTIRAQKRARAADGSSTPDDHVDKKARCD